MATTVASVNMRFTLPDRAAEAGLRRVLAERPDLVALQEWGVSRDDILRRIAAEGQYRWTRPTSPNGDPIMPVMWRDDRYVLRSARAIRLARREFVGHLVGRKSRLPASWASEVIFDDLASAHPDGEQTVLLDFHFTAEVQKGAGYRRDPAHRLRVRRHKRERRRLGKRARWHKRRGRTVYAAGDSNFHGLRLRGFVSCWTGRKGGTLGNRAVDVVFAATKPHKLWPVQTPSDHDALIVTYRRHD